MKMNVDMLCLRGRASLSLGPSLPIRLHQTERAASRQVTLLMASAGRDQAPYSYGLEAQHWPAGHPGHVLNSSGAFLVSPVKSW